MLAVNFAALFYLALAPTTFMTAARPLPISIHRGSLSEAPRTTLINTRREMQNDDYNSQRTDDSSDPALAVSTPTTGDNNPEQPAQDESDSDDTAKWYTTSDDDTPATRRALIARSNRSRSRPRRHSAYTTSHSGKQRLNYDLGRRQLLPTLGNLGNTVNSVVTAVTGGAGGAAVGKIASVNSIPIVSGNGSILSPAGQAQPQVNITSSSVAPGVRINPSRLTQVIPGAQAQ
ncbi:hypothetical protein AX16_006967 [Volvariella volvacea WC 439]|nr:hypothetical protein AX16_006967 [Volvariella volvacea WC 439]